MDILTTNTFRVVTPAGPDAVWRALTSPDQTARWFHGLTVESDWRPGSTVTARSAGGTLAGEVLAVAAPRRLSFTLAAGDEQPETFVTWEIHDAEVGSTVRLYLDEPDADDDTRATWLPVILALRALLSDSEVSTGSASPQE